MITKLLNSRKKKKNKEMKKLVEVAKVVEEEEESAPSELTRTKAEIAFQKMKEKNVRFYYLQL